LLKEKWKRERASGGGSQCMRPAPKPGGSAFHCLQRARARCFGAHLLPVAASTEGSEDVVHDILVFALWEEPVGAFFETGNDVLVVRFSCFGRSSPESDDEGQARAVRAAENRRSFEKNMDIVVVLQNEVLCGFFSDQSDGNDAVVCQSDLLVSGS